MGLPIFESGNGITQGRIRPAGWTPPDGSWVCCLGSDVPGVTGRLKAGDYFRVAQTGTAAAPNLVTRVLVRTRGPSSIPDGCWWEASWSVGGTVRRVVRLDVGETFDYAEWAAESADTADQSVVFQLTFQGPTGTIAEAELPAFYVDDITLGALGSGDLRIYDRYPEPGWRNAPSDAPVSFSAWPGSTTASTLTVTVNGQTAYTGGSFTPAFSGPLSAVTGGGSDPLHVLIDPLAIWGDSEAVTVAVTSSDPSAVGRSWSFGAQRLAGPKIASVMALGYKQVRVTFDEAAVAVSAANAGDALNPASYAIARPAGVVSVQPEVLAVTSVSASVFDLWTDLELTPAVLYTLTVQDVTDLFGNQTLAFSPGASATFAGWSPPVPIGRSFELYEMLAQKNRDEDQTGELRTFLACLQEPLDLLLYEIDSFGDILDPNTAPEQFLDAMLEDLGNPFTFPLTLTQKRQIAQLLLPIYQQKGTPQGIVNAIRLFLGVTVVHVAWGVGATIDGAAVLGDGGAFPGSFVLGSTVGLDPMGFKLFADAPLTGSVLTEATAIVRFMMRGECVFLGFDVATLPVTDNPVELGFDSVLGDGGAFPGTFILH